MEIQSVAHPDTPEQYLEQLSKRNSGYSGLRLISQMRETRISKIAYVDEDTEIANRPIANILQKVQETRDTGVRAVCIVEKIDAQTIARLGCAWEIPYDFFEGYLASSTVRKFEDTRTLEPIARSQDATALRTLSSRQRHVVGRVPYAGFDPERRQQNTPDSYHPWYMNTRNDTRMSYYRVTGDLYLFLVDGELLRGPRGNPGAEPARLSARFPWDNDGHSVPVPQLYSDDKFSPFAILKDFFSHEWHLKAICTPPDLVAIPGEVLAYMLAATTYETNVSWLDDEVKRMAFADIRAPNIELNNRLHDRRYDLNTLQTEVQWALKWIPDWIEQYCLEEVGEIALRSPRKVLDEVMSDSEYLDKFLMDTFQLVMSSISILDSAASIEQAKRGTLLTQLAAIYLPLSLVTGIFGMNIRGLPDAPAWSCAVALVSLIPLTLALLLVMKHVPLLDPGRQSSAKDRAKGDQPHAKLRISMAGFPRRSKKSDARSV